MKTLKDIVIPLVLTMASNGEQFSAYDVTTETRQCVNKLSETEALDLPSADIEEDFEYEVDHNEVKNIVNGMYRDGQLVRVFNGTYFIYSEGKPVVVASTVPTKPVCLAGPTSKEITDRVVKYLDRHAGPATMRLVMGSAFRFDYVPLAEVCSAIYNDRRLVWIDNSEEGQIYWTVDLK